MGARAARLVCERGALRTRAGARDAGLCGWRHCPRGSSASARGMRCPNQVALRMGASLLLLVTDCAGQPAHHRLPHVFGAVAQETLLIYFVHLCIVYGSIWNRGLAQIFGPTLGPGRTVVCVVLLLAAMAGLAWYWNWWKHTKPRAARWTAIGAGSLLLYRLFRFSRRRRQMPGAESPKRQAAESKCIEGPDLVMYDLRPWSRPWNRSIRPESGGACRCWTRCSRPSSRIARLSFNRVSSASTSPRRPSPPRCSWRSSSDSPS